MPSKNSKLTKLQEAFVLLFNGNATETARLAGYKGTDNALAVQGSKNLRMAKIVNAIQNRDQDKKEQKLLFRKIKDLEDLQLYWEGIMHNEVAITVKNQYGQEIEVPEVFFKDRIAASRLLGMSMGIFIDKKEVTGKNGGPIIVSNPKITLETSEKEAADIYNQLLKDEQ